MDSHTVIREAHRTDRLGFWLRPDEKELIRAAARRARRHVAQFVRETATERAREILPAETVREIEES